MSSWIYKLKKEDLINELEKQDIQLQFKDLSVEDLRKTLIKKLREQADRGEEIWEDSRSEEDMSKEKNSTTTARSPTDGSAVKITAEIQANKEIMQAVLGWNITFDNHNDPVDFIETLDEFIEGTEVNKEKLLHLLPRIFKGQALAWYRNNKSLWNTWDDFIQGFQLHYYPNNQENSLLERIIARKQRYLEDFNTYLTDIQTLMRRYGKLSEEGKLERIYENLNTNFKYYVKRKDFSKLNELISITKDFEKLNAERYKSRSTPNAATKPTLSSNRRPPDDDRIHRSNNGRKINPNYNSETHCWKCGMPDHLARGCRSRRAIFCCKCGIMGRTSFNCCLKTESRTIENESYTIRDVTRDNRIFIEIQLNGKKYEALLDTGATNSYINHEIYKELLDAGAMQFDTIKKVILADGSIIEINKALTLDIEIDGISIKHQVNMLPNTKRIIIGMDILKRLGMDIKWNKIEENKDIKPELAETNEMKSTVIPSEDSLDQAQKKELEQVLDEEFKKCENSPIGNKWVEHKIKLKHKEPVKQRYFPRNPKIQEIINEHVHKMLKDGIIEKSSSPYSSPVVLAKKEIGEYPKYDFEIQYRSGTQNKIADELSRNPGYASAVEKQNWYDKKFKEIAENQNKDENYCIKDGKLYKKITNHLYGMKLEEYSEWKLCVPREETLEILEQNHDDPSAGHLGVKKTLNRIAQRYTWPGMYKDVTRYVGRCEACQRHKPSQEKKAGVMHIKSANGKKKKKKKKRSGKKRNGGHRSGIVRLPKYIRKSQ
ncbi:hypothetical protein JYU34_013391 [Plutella xylostella]|uniref:RNA-directed DNA polymerase n=2 Tax=Plutella xylostella TaxID=51655 RepID=A0ABQ7Q9P2_PLUXY|nr:hypothetical protein JYU34_013391 [Plutella xylostella]